MDNTFVKSTKIQVDYQAILDVLIAKTKEVWPWRVHSGLPTTNGSDVRDYRTVGFFCGRQTGKTDTLVEFIARQPFGSCMVLTKDALMLRAINARYNKLTISGVVIPGMQICHVRKCIKDGKSLGDYHNNADEVKYILVDDASITINVCGVTNYDFNKWVGENFPEDTIVIRVG